MASPAAKKSTKDNSNAQSPIIFHTPGRKPDVLLKAFDIEYHVHSAILKLKSSFFRKFLDPPNPFANHSLGTASTPGSVCKSVSSYSQSSASLHYFWETKIDADGSWSLTRKDPKNEPFHHLAFKGNKELENKSFEKLLCAIYTTRYHFDSADELLKMVEFADYYCCLPTLSTTIDGALLNSPKRGTFIRFRCVDLYAAATKVRNAVLFRDCLIWLCSDWEMPSYTKVQDNRLRLVASSAYGEISSKVAQVTHMCFAVAREDLLGEGSNCRDYIETFRSACLCVPHQVEDGSFSLSSYDISLPAYLRSLKANAVRNLSDCDELEELLKDYLVLDRHENHDDVEYCFFCAKISDEYLPWDITETDW